MANELSWRHSSTGKTVYVTIRSAVRTMWNGSALEALTVANWGNYDIALAETPSASYFHVGDWPAALSTVGWYWIDIYEQAGGSPAISDSLIGTLYGYWNGTLFEPAGGDMKQVNGTAQTATNIGAAIAALNNISTTQVQASCDAAITSSAIIGQILGAIAGKFETINETQVKLYKRNGDLLVTLNRTGTDPAYTWTPTWA